jgi:hypothetical protein
MNIATINDTLFPVVLFVIYFCFISVVRYNLKEKANVSTEKEVSKTSQEQSKPFTYKDAFSAEFDPDTVAEIAPEIMASVELESVFKVEALISPEMTDDNINDPTNSPSNQQSIPEIIDSLGKRDIRKLCAPLGIQQKTNGTELTTELMKALVKRKLKENPQIVVEVISVRVGAARPKDVACRRQPRLPHLLPTLSKSNQQQLDSLAC